MYICASLFTLVHLAVPKTVNPIRARNNLELLVSYVEATGKSYQHWVDGLCPVTYRYRESNLNCMRGLYPSAIHDHTSTCYLIAIVKTSHSEQ